MSNDKENTKKGYVAVFSGTDYSGKTTISKHVVQILKEVYHLPAVWYRGPGGTQFGERIRESMFSPGLNCEPSNLAMLHAMMASHAQIVDEVLVPAKESGTIVVVDRFVEATYSYQGTTPQLRDSIQYMIGQMVPFGLIDKQFVIKASPEILKQRKASRGVDNFLDTKSDDFYAGVTERLLSYMYEQHRNGKLVEHITNEGDLNSALAKAQDIAQGIMSAYLHQ